MPPNSLHSSIVVKGHQIDLGEALPEHVREKLSQAAEKSFGGLKHAAVGFSRDGLTYRCTINAQVGNLKVIIGEAPAGDCYRAFDVALARVVEQVQRRRERLKRNRPGRIAGGSHPAGMDAVSVQ
ncbi:ribosome hibernation-promoting factor, HPF/YfiA family [Microvirga sp. 17 mud 1-3]|uniref:ribosome hibernation-promoting factor, HPF/YfiA family n=1 Tax=Microvirga sp. 17 mud 1-3 TaxID=2082949 RepID=UPI000D6BEA8E|nr:ribosome-associated translation inhibitor RaiA [Microvirga sp. 17 mud 1-3]AWM85421.1 ribosome-associated translation inhibitor RaiA [Microvirga sp. 17 mud 1-3]